MDVKQNTMKPIIERHFTSTDNLIELVVMEYKYISETYILFFKTYGQYCKKYELL